jgi:hypothetical protein
MPKVDDRMRPFAVRIPEQLFLGLQYLAHQEKRSINAQILHMLEQAHAQTIRSERKRCLQACTEPPTPHTWHCLRQQIR